MKCWNLYCITWSMTLLIWYCSILPTTAPVYLWRLTENIHKKLFPHPTTRARGQMSERLKWHTCENETRQTNRLPPTYQYLLYSTSIVPKPLGECHKTSLMIRKHWFWNWLGAVRQKIINRAYIGPRLCRHLASPGCNAKCVLCDTVHVTNG